MSFIFIIMAVMLVAFMSINSNDIANNSLKKRNPYSLAAVLLSALLVRIILAIIYPGYETDMNCFSSWSNRIYKNGFSEFYTSGSFADYPPGYMYILYIIGFIKNTFTFSQTGINILLKMPAIICDIITGLLIYKLSEKENKNATLISCLYLFNPLIILNSAVWGQVDSVFLLPVFLMLIFLMNKKLIPAYFMFAISIFIKPQALFYAPILLCAIVKDVFLEDFSYKKLFTNLLYGLLAILSIFILAMPFGISSVINQYVNTISSYNYASINAYNLWSGLGLNWHKLTGVMSFIAYVFIATSTLLCMYLFFKDKSKERYFSLSALICFSVFVLSVKMHERYAFPSVLFIFVAFLLSGKKVYLTLYALLSSLLFFNTAHVLFYYDPKTYYSSGFSDFTVLFGIVSVLILIYWLYAIFTNKIQKKLVQNEKNQKEVKPKNKISKETLNIKRDYKIDKKDITIAFIITLLYTLVALYNLGDKASPESYATINTGEEITIDLGEDVFSPQIIFFNGFKELSDNRTLNIELTSESGEVSEEIAVNKGGVFAWKEVSTVNDARYITLSSTDTLHIFEFGIHDGDGNRITPVSSQKMELIDEQDLVPMHKSYKNGTYFDEIYHARTAYEYVNELQVYEWTHPPLGKVFISLGVKLFGMNPFGWRIIGTLFGVFMLPLIYVFLKKMLGIRWVTVCGTILLAADFMHFAQSRIATIDVYATFFILMMYLFMYKYYTEDMFLRTDKKGYIMLGLCGLSMAFAVSVKWTGLYSACGLFILFLMSLVRCYKIDNKDFFNKLLKTVLFCLVFFVVIPITIYGLSYIPFVKANNEGIINVINNQRDMFIYHSKTVVKSTHPFSSHWYEWILNLRPIWYYSGHHGEYAESISSFGNPLIWWSGFLAFIYCVFSAVKKKDMKAIVLVIAYASAIIPWTFVERTTFIYHYFPAVPFLVLMICLFVSDMAKYYKSSKKLFIAFTILSVALFIIFYPSISGLCVKEAYLEMLKWLPRWQII